MADLKIEYRNITDLIPSERTLVPHSPEQNQSVSAPMHEYSWRWAGLKEKTAGKTTLKGQDMYENGDEDRKSIHGVVP